MKSSEVPPGVLSQDVEQQRVLPLGAPCAGMLTEEVFRCLAPLRTRGLRLYPSVICPQSGAVVVRGQVPTYHIRQLVIHLLTKANVVFIDDLAIAF